MVVQVDVQAVVVAGVAHGSSSGPVVSLVQVPGHRKRTRLRMERIENTIHDPLSSSINL